MLFRMLNGFLLFFPFFFVTNNDYYVIVVTIIMDANRNLISFLESHSWFQFFIFHISKTLFCFLWSFVFSSSKINQRNLTTVIFSSVASLVSKSSSHTCPDGFFIAVNMFSITFWAFCLSLWILLLPPYVIYNFITLLMISSGGSSASSQGCPCFISSIASFMHRTHEQLKTCFFWQDQGDTGDWQLRRSSGETEEIYFSQDTPHYLF